MYIGKYDLVQWIQDSFSNANNANYKGLNSEKPNN